MKITLNKSRDLTVIPASQPGPLPDGLVRMEVLYCAICRTDAKCWQQGHRDLAMPRVLGHEIAARDPESGTLYTLWPGQVCGSCAYCRSGRENLCEKIRIIGFHNDGGFASWLDAPRSCFVAAPPDVAAEHLCFAEPAACVLNAFTALDLHRNESIIIYGAGVVGLLAGVLAKSLGARPTIIELNQEKITKARTYVSQTDIPILQDTLAGDFHLALNACDSPMAFSQCILKLRKGGRVAFFSGLKKNEELDANLLNLIHYKELQVVGSYGPRPKHMRQALPMLAAHGAELNLLIEDIIRPEKVAEVMAEVGNGSSYKYIIDCQVKAGDQGPITSAAASPPRPDRRAKLPAAVQALVANIEPVGDDLRAAAQAKIDYKTKPLGALGRIEKLAVQLSCIQQSLRPETAQKNLIVFAGDHGVVEEGVSAFPAKVTVQMVENFLAGGAAINVFCRHHDIQLAVADLGVKGDLPDHAMLYKEKIGRGTNNFTLERAMSLADTCRAVVAGARVFNDMQQKQPCKLLGLGEMGIGNTSAATAIISAATGRSVAEVCGRGTGIDDKGLERKIEVIERAMSLHKPAPDNGLELLSQLGGYEIAGIAGAALAAASHGICVVLDGVISTAGGLIATLLAPQIRGYLVSGHKSVEVGQQAALKLMGLTPVIDLDFRLGEGTGAAHTMNTIDLACAIMRDMASFQEAGVANSENP